MGQNLEQLEQIIKICRKTGVIHFRNSEFEFKLSKSALSNNKSKDSDSMPKVTGVPTPEQMLHYSSLPFTG